MQIIKEESKKLGLDAKFELRIYENDELSSINVNGYSGKNRDGGFVIGSNKSNLDRILIRHELYHIARGDLKDDESAYAGKSKTEDMKLLTQQYGESFDGATALNYLYFKESAVNLYSWSGIKL